MTLVALLAVAVWHPEVNAAGPNTHVVQEGDTLYDIAERYGVTIARIAEENGLDDPSFIRIGQELVISPAEEPPAAPPPVQPTAPAQPSSTAPAPTNTAVPSSPSAVPALPTVASARSLGSTGRRYVVEPGDHIYAIARKNGVSVQAILDLNKLESPDFLTIGQVIQIPDSGSGQPPVASAVTSTVTATRPPASPTSVPPATATSVPPTKAPATATPKPATPTAKPSAPQASPTSSSIKTIQVNVSPAAGAATATPVRPTDAAIPGAPKLVWPAQGRISQYFGENGHRGLDIERPNGSPLVGAGDGVVVAAAKGGDGRGWYVQIDHGNGWVTEYQHLGSFSVAQGDRVKAGQVFGTVGMTGWTTGPHLHFEVQKDGAKLNPLRYLP